MISMDGQTRATESESNEGTTRARKPENKGATGKDKGGAIARRERKTAGLEIREG